MQRLPDPLWSRSAEGLYSLEPLGFADLGNLVPATTSTVYNMGSVSKALTAIAVMQLLQEGK